MKKLALFGILMFSLVLVSCPLDFSYLPSLGVELDKDEVSVGETVKLLATINKAYINNETSLIFYIEDYPKDYEILKGTIYEKLTDEMFIAFDKENFTVKLAYEVDSGLMAQMLDFYDSHK